jgi:hypothetical protein
MLKDKKGILVSITTGMLLSACLQTLAAETTLVCEKGRLHNTCLDNGKTVSVRAYVNEHSKYKKVVDTKAVGNYNNRKIEIKVKK